MLNKNAFSLVELLAVIVIIGVIATITAPILLNVINKANEDTFLTDATALSKAANNYYTSLTLDSDTKLPLLVTYTNSKETNTYMNNATNSCETSSNRILQYTGQTPYSGNIFIDSNGDVYMAIFDNASRKCAIKNPGDKTVTITSEKEENCKLNKTPC